MAIAGYKKTEWRIHYYRDDRDQEVDLIIDKGNSLMACEVKYSKKVRKEDFTNLHRFAAVAKKPVQSFVIFQGRHREKFDAGMAVPFGEFLQELNDAATKKENLRFIKKA